MKSTEFINLSIVVQKLCNTWDSKLMKYVYYALMNLYSN